MEISSHFISTSIVTNHKLTGRSRLHLFFSLSSRSLHFSTLLPAPLLRLCSRPHRGKNTIHKLSFSLCVNASVYTSQTQVCTQRNAALLCPHSPLRNQDWHSGVNDALTSSPSPQSSLLPSQYTNAAPQSSIWCGNSFHISCQPERFWGPNLEFCIAEARGLLLASCPVLVKAPLDLRSRSKVWFQLGYG